MEIKPYGDARGDGLVQVSFTLPLAETERARQSALEDRRARWGSSDRRWCT